MLLTLARSTAGAKLTAEGDYFQKGAHPTPSCTSLSLAGMRAPQVYICELGPLGEGNGVPAKSVFQRLQRALLGSFPPLPLR